MGSPAAAVDRPGLQRPCRILYIEDAYHLGGDSKTSLSLLEHLDRDRFEVSLVTSDDGGVFAQAQAIQGIRHLPARFGVRPGYLEAAPVPTRVYRRVVAAFQLSLLAIRLSALVVSQSIDLIVSRDRTRSCLLAAVVSLSTRRPHIFYPGCHFHEMRGRFRRWIARRASLLVGNSDFTTRSFVAAGVDPRRAVTVHNSIDPGPFLTGHDAGFRSAHELPDDAIVFGWVGSWLTVKGVYEAIKAFQQVSAGHPEAFLLLVGGGDSSRGRRMVEELGLGERVRVVPYQMDVATVYQAMDIFLMPSWNEPFGRVTIEAMVSGLPVIGAAGGATPEIVVDGETGILFTPRDVEGLAGAMTWMLDHRPGWRTWGVQARSRALELFTDDRRVSRMEALFGEATAPRRLAAAR